MTQRGLPQILIVLALSGCAGSAHPRLTEQPLPSLTDRLLPTGQSLVESAVTAAVIRIQPDSMTRIVAIGPGANDSITVAAPPMGLTSPHTLRFTNIQLQPDSLAITMQYAYVCGGRCGQGGTIALHRNPGRDWTVWSFSTDWRI